jgi:hypothetical protein
MLAATVALVGCARKSDREQVEASLQSSPFFRALGAIPGASEGYTGHGLLADGDTSLPLWAHRTVHKPDIDYTITVERPYANVDFALAWPCTLTVIYTDLPDTSVRDTVVKPAPTINGTISARFELVGDEWQATELSPCAAEFDSAVGKMRIDSVQVSVRRNGQTVNYPTLAGTGRLLLNAYPYTFQAGDSVSLRLWETHEAGVDFAWAFLHGPPGHWCSAFQFDQATGSFYGTWVISQQAEHQETRWVWFQVADLNSAIIRKDMPDRAVLWGLVYMIQ